MLHQIADGVLIHKSEFVQSNAVVVQGPAGALLIDPGVHRDEMICLANDLSDSGLQVGVGFSTHPHWDHLLWLASFGAAPRYGTARCAFTAREELSRGIDPVEDGIPDEVSTDLLGLISGLDVGTVQLPWDGSRVQIIEHQAHAPGHAALLIEECGVLVAGDMLSDVLIPLLNFDDALDPIEEYLAALNLIENVAGSVDVLVPGHGAVAGPADLRTRIDWDREYVERLRDGRDINDPRFTFEYCREWLPGVHAGQVEALAQRRA